MVQESRNESKRITPYGVQTFGIISTICRGWIYFLLPNQQKWLPEKAFTRVCAKHFSNILNTPVTYLLTYCKLWLLWAWHSYITEIASTWASMPNIYVTRPRTRYKLVPMYLADDCLVISAIAGKRYLRSTGTGLLSVPRTRTTLGMRSFVVAGPVIWNSLYQPPCEPQLSPHWRLLDIWRPNSASEDHL